jgi:hypothetical protein
MLVKYVEGNGKIKDLDGVLQTMKKLSPTTLGVLEQGGLGIQISKVL